MRLHGNARLSVKGRELLIDRMEVAGWSLSSAAEAAGISDRTARKWLARYRAEGRVGLLDRSSAPRVLANRTDERRVEVIAALRRLRLTGVEIAECLQMAHSTVSGILTRIGMGKLGRLGLEPAQRYERARPGELIHIDVKKLGRIQGGAGKRVRDGRRQHYNARKSDAAGVRRHTVGWEYVHVCIDDATRLAYVEVLADEKATTAAGFLRRAIAHYASYGITVERFDHRQRLGLPVSHPRDRLPHPGHPPSPHSPLPPADQRQSRTIHPHDAQRLGLRRDLPLKRRAQRRARWLARLLQSPTTTRRPQPPAPARSTTRAQREQPPRVLQPSCPCTFVRVHVCRLSA
jgi:transposase